MQPSATLPPLEALVAAARSRSPAASEARARTRLSEVEREEELLGLLPSLTATASYQRNQEEVGIPIVGADGTTQTIVTQPLDQLDLRLRVDLTLVDAGAFSRAGASQLDVEVAELDASTVAERAERDVVRAYFERIAADAVVEAAEASAATARENLRVVEVRAESELATKLDVERARAAVEGAGRTRADALLSQRLATRRLRSLTGLDVGGESPALDADLTVVPAVPAEAAPSTPSVLLARKRLEVAEGEETTAWLALVPRVTAFAEERFTNGAGFGPSPAYALGLSAEWRLSPSVFGAGRTAGARAEVARASTASAEADAGAALEDAYLEVLARIESARAARAEARAALTARASAEELYLAGKATQIEVVTAARDALDREVDRIRADANLELARALHRLAAGSAGGAR